MNIEYTGKAVEVDNTIEYTAVQDCDDTHVVIEMEDASIYVLADDKNLKAGKSYKVTITEVKD